MLNIFLENATDQTPAIIFKTESEDIKEISWKDLHSELLPFSII